jgi:hypothetical protein
VQFPRKKKLNIGETFFNTDSKNRKGRERERENEKESQIIQIYEKLKIEFL